MTKSGLYSKLELFANGYGDNEITIDREHAKVILENKKQALINARIASESYEKKIKDLERKIKKYQRTQEEDQSKLIESEMDNTILSQKLMISEIDTKKAKRETLICLEKRPRHISTITGYNKKGEYID